MSRVILQILAPLFLLKTINIVASTLTQEMKWHVLFMALDVNNADSEKSSLLKVVKVLHV